MKTRLVSNLCVFALFSLYVPEKLFVNRVSVVRIVINVHEKNKIEAIL